jgi:hypothetical protein
MSIYSGNKSLDAEIQLNFQDETIVMDYSLNKFGSPYSSNNTMTLNDEFSSKPLLIRLKYVLLAIFAHILSIPVFATMPILTTITEHSPWKRKNSTLQYKVQSLYKWVLLHRNGTFIQSRSGAIHENKVVFIMPSNLWFEYNLEGEYEEKIKTIELTRNFIPHARFGIFICEKQRGWKTTFEFTSPPQNGSCSITYVAFS